jgi:hypothetical protein
MSVIAWVLLFAAHSRSEGESRFDIGEDGRVDVVITLGASDVPELCDAELALVDPARRAVAEQKFTACVESGLTRWLRLRIDDETCAMAAGSWRRSEGYAVVLSTTATCDLPRGRALTVDWGLFHDAPLEHVSQATFVLPDGTERRALLSRRHNRAVIDIPGALWRRFLPGAPFITAAFILLAVVVLRRRRRHVSR